MSFPFSICMVWTTAVVANGVNPRALSSDPSAACAIVAAAATPVLPAKLGAFFDGHLDEIVAASGADPSDGGTPSITLAPQRGPLVARAAEVAGTQDEWLARSVHGAFVELRDAFRLGDASAIEPGSGRLLRLVTDAALPFRAVRDAVGGWTGTLSWADRGSPKSVRSDRSLRLRVELGAMARLRDRLSYEVRVAPERYTRIFTPYDAGLQFVRDTDAALDALGRADVEVMQALGIVDADGFVSKRSAYYKRFTQRAAPILEDRLEAAVLMYSKLVGTAWEDAGQPKLGVGEVEATPKSRAQDARATRVIYVGSRHSEVFHKSTCPHARRIKPSNRVRFDTAAAAMKVGRTPCRTCKPALRP